MPWAHSDAASKDARQRGLGWSCEAERGSMARGRAGAGDLQWVRAQIGGELGTNVAAANDAHAQHRALGILAQLLHLGLDGHGIRRRVERLRILLGAWHAAECGLRTEGDDARTFSTALWINQTRQVLCPYLCMHICFKLTPTH